MPLIIKGCNILKTESDAIIIQSNYRIWSTFYASQVKPSLCEVTQSCLPPDRRKKQLYVPNVHGTVETIFQMEFPDQIGNYTVFQCADNVTRYIILMDPLPEVKDVFLSQAIVQSLRRSIISMFQFLQKHGIGSVAMPILGMGKNGFPLELAQNITIQSIQMYMQNYDGNFCVTLVNSFKGLPLDMVSDEDNFQGDIENREQDAEIQALYQDFLMNRKIFLSQNIKESEESYGRSLQLLICKKYIHSEYELVNITKLNKNTIAKFRKGKTQKHRKAVQLRLALGMKLPLDDFCRYLWASGDNFPNDDRDTIILGFIRDGIYDVESIEKRIESCLGCKSKLIKEKDI